MELAARTAPKAKGVDTILVRILTGNEILTLADRLAATGERRKTGFFVRDAKNIAACDACVISARKGGWWQGSTAGHAAMQPARSLPGKVKKRKKRTTDFSGPNCSVRMTDLGIALGSAVKTAQIHNVDNRIMYSAGTAALDLGLLGKDCTVAYAIPLSATGKNIFFDREVAK
jgi:uncharacterized ferredoxin-like protein